MASAPTPGAADRPELEAAEEQLLLLHGLTYEQYVTISDALGDKAGVRLAYCGGTLEIVTPSNWHEETKKSLARLIEVYALVRGVKLYGFGSTTYRAPRKKRGLEPDECYCLGGPKEVPDLAIEVALRGHGLDKLVIYASLGVREVWTFRAGRLEVRALGAAGYAERARSALLPELDLEVLAEHVRMSDQDAAVRAYFALLGG